MEKIIELERNFTIKELPETERPREKLSKYGAEKLSNEELLAIIIRTGSRTESALDVSKKILSRDNRGLTYLRDATIQELMEVRGIGECKAAQILSAIELGKRLSYQLACEKFVANNPVSIADIFMDDMRYLKKEHFRILLLDIKNQIISTEQISVGTLNASIVHPRDVFNIAIKRNASSIILIHNHPSGDPTPSKEDKNITKRLIETGRITGIEVLDHIIIGDNKFLSFRHENLM